LKGDPLRLHYTSTLTDNSNVYGENVGKKVTGKKVTEKQDFILFDKGLANPNYIPVYMKVYYLFTLFV
jgi:hypothetical protein